MGLSPAGVNILRHYRRGNRVADSRFGIGKMKYKTPEVRRRWLDARVHSKLQSLAHDVESEISEMTDAEMTMTESSRTRAETIAIKGDPAAPVSTHESVPLRAFDIRSRDENGVEFPWVQRLVAIINKRWIYDPARPAKSCAMYHDVGKGPHLHFQVCDKTVFRGSNYQGAA